MNRNADLGTFLRTRRARLNPTDVGLRATARRRVPGLRREELAALAGLSVGHYARLEQGRQLSTSPSVLDALARVLRLTEDERRHLYTLAAVTDTRSITGDLPCQTVDPRVRRIVHVFGDTPAVLCGPYTDVLVVNDAARFLLADFTAMPPHDRYTIKWHLFAPEARELYGDDWEGVATELIGMLRVQAGRYPADPRMRGLVAELGTRSALFRGQWAEHRVSTGLRNRNVLNHPRAGRVEVSNELVTLHAAAENTLFLLIPDDAGSFTTAFRKFVAAARVNPLRHVPAAADAPTSALREAGPTSRDRPPRSVTSESSGGMSGNEWRRRLVKVEIGCMPIAAEHRRATSMNRGSAEISR